MAPPVSSDASSKLVPVVVVDADNHSADPPTTRPKAKRTYRDSLSPESDQSLEQVGEMDESHPEQRDSDPDYISSDSGPRTSRVKPRKGAKRDAPKKAGEKRPAKYAAFRKVNRRTTNDVKKLWDKVDDRDSQIAYLQDKVRRKDEKIDKLQGTTLAISRKRIEGKAEKIGGLEGDLRLLKDDLRLKKEQIDNLQQELDSKASVIQKIQEDSLRKLEAADFQSDPDYEVAAQLSKIFRSTKGWAGKYAIATWSAIDAEARKAVEDRLRDASVPSVASSNARIAIRQGKIVPKVVANALLNRTLVWLTLGDPFGIVAGAKSNGGDLSSAAMLTNIYKSIERKFPSAGGKFRCMTAYSMLPEGCDLTGVPKSDTLKADTEGVAKSVLETAMCAVSLLLNMNDATKDNIELSLLKIIRTSISTGVRIHAQYPHITFDFREMLRRHHFSVNNDYLVAHPAMQLKDVEDSYAGKTAEEAGIVQRSPDLIVEPLVRRSGDEQGEEWSYKRVIHKATVWICNPQDLENTDLVPETPSEAVKAPGPQKSSKELKKTSPPDAPDTSVSGPPSGRISQDREQTKARKQGGQDQTVKIKKEPNSEPELPSKTKREPNLQTELPSKIKREPDSEPELPNKKPRTDTGVSTRRVANRRVVAPAHGRTDDNSNADSRQHDNRPDRRGLRELLASINPDNDVMQNQAARFNKDKGRRQSGRSHRVQSSNSKATDKAAAVSSDEDIDMFEGEERVKTPPLN